MRNAVLCSLALLAGCAVTSNVVSADLVKRKAAADLSCPADQITTQQISDTSWKVSGCDKQLSLSCWTSPGMGEGTCTKEPAGM